MAGTARITLIHTNDFHSNLDLWPHTAAVVKAELARAEAGGRPAAYVDAGDQMEMSERTCYGTAGETALVLLSQLGCKAFTIGNNETMRTTMANLTGLAARSPFPWLGANMRDLAGNPLPGIKDWTIVPVGPVKVGIFGLTPPYPAVAGAMGLSHPDTDETIRRCAAELRAAGADLVLFLSHLGLDVDRLVAEGGAPVDLIIGGHTHNDLAEPEVINGIPIAQAGASGKFVGVLELDVDLAGRRLAGCTGRLVAVDPADWPADSDAATAVAKLRQRCEAALNEVLTVLPEGAPHDSTGDSRLGPMIAEAMRRKAGAEIGLTVGAQAVSGFPAGPVTRAQVMTALPPLFIPAVLEMEGRTLKEILEQSQDPAVYLTPSGAGGQRPRGVPIGRIFAAGVTYEVDPGAPVGSRVRNVQVGGAPLEDGRVYKVGGPSLMGFPEAGYPAFAGVTIARRFMPELAREVFEAALRDGLT